MLPIFAKMLPKIVFLLVAWARLLRHTQEKTEKSLGGNDFSHWLLVISYWLLAVS